MARDPAPHLCIRTDTEGRHHVPRERVAIPTEPTPGVCTGPNCHRPVLWVMTVGNARMCLDPEPSMRGTVVLLKVAPGRQLARVLDGRHLPTLKPCYVQHATTCPDSEHFRRRHSAAMPKCRAGCGVPMAPRLVADGWRYHVLCAPDAEFEGYMRAARRRRPGGAA